jgi:hypothetical protein
MLPRDRYGFESIAKNGWHDGACIACDAAVAEICAEFRKIMAERYSA